MTVNCISCGESKVDTQDVPRYDVFAPGADLEHPKTIGPYCEDCWPDTVTAQQTQ